MWLHSSEFLLWGKYIPFQLFGSVQNETFVKYPFFPKGQNSQFCPVWWAHGIYTTSSCCWQDGNGSLELHLISPRLEKSSAWQLRFSLLGPNSRTGPTYKWALQGSQVLFSRHLTLNWLVQPQGELQFTCLWLSFSNKNPASEMEPVENMAAALPTAVIPLTAM